MSDESATTRVHAGDRSLASVPEGAMLPANPAFSHAPTLLSSSETPGLVTVWAPVRWRLLLPAVGWGVVTLVSILALSVLNLALGTVVGVLSLTSFLNYAARRPYYVTTDSAGIGVTSLQGTRAVRWSDILSAWLEGESLHLRLPRRFSVQMGKCPPEVRSDLLEAVKARLPEDRWNFDGRRRIELDVSEDPDRDVLYDILRSIMAPHGKGLVRRAPESVEIPLYGYGPARQKELLKLIVASARLRATKADRNRFEAPRRRALPAPSRTRIQRGSPALPPGPVGGPADELR